MIVLHQSFGFPTLLVLIILSLINYCYTSLFIHPAASCSPGKGRGAEDINSHEEIGTGTFRYVSSSSVVLLLKWCLLMGFWGCNNSFLPQT